MHLPFRFESIGTLQHVGRNQQALGQLLRYYTSTHVSMHIHAYMLPSPFSITCL